MTLDQRINERARLNEWEASILNREEEWDSDERDLAMIETARQALRGDAGIF